jgi:ATP-dependent Lon protease, bacterial type
MKKIFIQRERTSSPNDSNDDVTINPIKKKPHTETKLTFNEHKTKHDMVMKEMLMRDITMNDVFKLDLPMDEYIWFMEHLKILNKLEEYSEDKFRVKTVVYQRYMNLQSIDINMLNKIKCDSKVDNNIVTRILESTHSDSVKAILYKKYKRCSDNAGTTGMSDEYFKMIEWVDNVLNLPTRIIHNEMDSINTKLIKLWKSLNDNISGLQHVKEKVMETMCAKLLDPENKGKILLFVGPPGVGKTAMALLIAESLGKPFDQISFGSIKDSTMLTGHSSTYIGAVPGLFTKILLKSGRLDTVVLLDELDKIPDTSEGKSISSVLLHVLDRTQNHRFRDMYMTEIVIDLSKMIFFAAANDLKNIDSVLLDRTTIIELSGYDLDQKTNIAAKHMFPRIKKELGFSETDLILKDKEIKYLIKNKTKINQECEKWNDKYINYANDCRY